MFYIFGLEFRFFVFSFFLSSGECTGSLRGCFGLLQGVACSCRMCCACPQNFIIVEVDVRVVIQFVCIYAVHPKSLVDPEEGDFLNIYSLYLSQHP